MVNELKEFRELGLKRELLEALNDMEFRTMTEVQELVIPVVLHHKDLVVRSKTGKRQDRRIPCADNAEHRAQEPPAGAGYSPYKGACGAGKPCLGEARQEVRVRSTVVYGGASINMQMQSLRRGADVVIGTPGRIIDLMERGSLVLDRISFLVLDEADLMLDMGFIEDVELIISNAPADRQTMLFSATMPREILDIARKHMKADVAKITVGEEEDLTVSTISHTYFIGNGRMKFAALLSYIEKFKPKKCIIFTSTQRESEYVHNFLRDNGLSAIVMHGGLTQAMRERSLHEFKTHATFLISTNLASRGLDIPDITDIINFDAPDDPRVYVHRVGRSARMGKDGRAFTIFGYDQEDLMRATTRLANIRMDKLTLDTDKFKNVQLPMQRSRHGGGGGFDRNRPRREFHGGREQGGRDRGGRDQGRRGGRSGWHGSSGNNRHEYKRESH